jgi:hypothetical protein
MPRTKRPHGGATTYVVRAGPFLRNGRIVFDFAESGTRRRFKLWRKRRDRRARLSRRINRGR